MELNKNAGLTTTYLNVADGHLVQRHKEKTSQTTERINKIGNTVLEEMFKIIKGIIIDVNVFDSAYGKNLVIRFKNAFLAKDKVNKTEKYNYVSMEGYVSISMSYKSRYSSSFLKRLPNTDRFGEVELMPWEMIDKVDPKKKITGITLYQGCIKIPSAFSKENPNGIPPMVKHVIGDKTIWDDTAMMDFLMAKASEWIKEEVPF